MRELWFPVLLVIAAVGASHACGRVLAPHVPAATAPKPPPLVCTAERPRRRCL